jgi:hypothetical protein
MYVATIIAIIHQKRMGLAEYENKSMGQGQGQGDTFPFTFFFEGGRKLEVKAGKIVFSNNQIDREIKSALTTEQKIVFENPTDDRIERWAMYDDYQERLEDIRLGRVSQKPPREMFRVTRGA